MGLLTPSKAQKRVIDDVKELLAQHTASVFLKLNSRQHAHAWNEPAMRPTEVSRAPVVTISAHKLQ